MTRVAALVVLALLLAAGIVLGRAPSTPELPAAVRAPPPPVTAATAALPADYEVELDGAAEAPPERRRTAIVDLAPVVGRSQRVHVVYDVDLATRPETLEALRSAPDWVAGVRLLLGEMGAWRLRDGRWSLLEGVGILETVTNRFDPDLANPLRIPRVASWPGCGVGGTFATCIDPGEYLGMATDRSLRPRAACPDAEQLHAALDRAVAAWFVFEEGLLGEITAGATSFVHLCGGEGYGRAHTDCDRPGDDPSRGPIVFRGPNAWLAKQGRYALSALGTVDFVAGPPPTAPRAYVDYLLGEDATVYAEAAERSPPRALRER